MIYNIHYDIIFLNYIIYDFYRQIHVFPDLTSLWKSINANILQLSVIGSGFEFLGITNQHAKLNVLIQIAQYHT